MRINRHATYFSLGCSIFFCLAGTTCFGQVAKQFVKVDANQCWLDVQDAVHRRANGVVVDDRLHTLTIDRFASVDGTIAIVVAVEADKNKKGEPGCAILVGETGNDSPHGSAAKVNAMNGSGNIGAAMYIAAQVNAAQKLREKKAKSNNPEK
jgi:hypothetical protein